MFCVWPDLFCVCSVYVWPDLFCVCSVYVPEFMLMVSDVLNRFT